jgi:Predicted membrane protein
MLKKLFKPLAIFSLAAVLFFSQVDGALAARSGGRIGGGSFRSSPSRSYNPSPGRSGGGYYGGGGFGFPFLIPFFGFGGGGLFSLLIFMAIAGFVFNSIRSAMGQGQDEAGYTSNPTVSVARLQVGLLAQARNLQADLDRMAQTADTGSAAGRAQVLQEATLAMLRHPEYWAYGSSHSEQTGINAAEAKFNQFALAERSKFTEETLSNVNNQLIGGVAPLLTGNNANLVSETGNLTASENEYIVVTLVVGTLGKIELPKVNSPETLRQALSRLGSVGSEQLLAVEILWTPQASGDTLSTDDMLAYYPDLSLV